MYDSIFKILNKGFIQEGYDADLVIVGIKQKKKVINDKLFTKCGWSPFAGKTLKGWPIKTIVNGNLIFDQGSIYDTKAREVCYYDK